MEEIDAILGLLRGSEETRWVADQLASTFSQGVSMNVKEAMTDVRFFELAPPGLTMREQQKREKYETTRPYTDLEKLQLLRDALKIVFLELPAIQVAGVTTLLELGARAERIEFLPPGEPEQAHSSYIRDLSEVQSRQPLLAKNLQKFLDELSK